MDNICGSNVYIIFFYFGGYVVIHTRFTTNVSLPTSVPQMLKNIQVHRCAGWGLMTPAGRNIYPPSPIDIVHRHKDWLAFCAVLLLVIQLQAHIRTHYTDKLYHCRHCLAGFNEKTNLDRHCQTVHPLVRMLARCASPS